MSTRCSATSFSGAGRSSLGRHGAARTHHLCQILAVGVGFLAVVAAEVGTGPLFGLGRGDCGAQMSDGAAAAGAITVTKLVVGFRKDAIHVGVRLVQQTAARIDGVSGLLLFGLRAGIFRGFFGFGFGLCISDVKVLVLVLVLGVGEIVLTLVVHLVRVKETLVEIGVILIAKDAFVGLGFHCTARSILLGVLIRGEVVFCDCVVLEVLGRRDMVFGCLGEADFTELNVGLRRGHSRAA